MGRRRYISTDISLDEDVDAIAQVSDFAALLYTWMIPHVKDDAITTGSAKRILAEVMPLRRDKTTADVEAALELIESMGLFELRTADSIYWPPDTFYKYQSYIQAKNRRSEDAISCERRKTPQIAASLSLSPSLPPTDQTPVPSRSPEPQRNKRGSYPQAEPEGLPGTLAYFSEKVDRELTSEEISWTSRHAKRFGCSVVARVIGDFVPERGVDLPYMTGCVKNWSKTTTGVAV